MEKKKLATPTIYYLNGFRYVKPFPFFFSCYAKKRWFGRTIADIFVNEFKGYDEDNLATYCKEGFTFKKSNKNQRQGNNT